MRDRDIPVAYDKTSFKPTLDRIKHAIEALDDAKFELRWAIEEP